MNISDLMMKKEGELPLDELVTDGGFCGIFRRIACIGDSLSSGEFESKRPDGSTGYHDFYEYSWGQYIGRSCGSLVYNFSRGGMTAKEYVETFADQNGFWSTDKLAQAYIIALGVNDVFYREGELGSLADICREDYRKNGKTFAGYYAQIIAHIRELQPRARIFLVTMPSEGGKRDPVIKRHRDLLAEMTKIFPHTHLIDLYTYAPRNDEAYNKIFRLGHMTPTGYVLTARMIESYIDYIIRTEPEDFSQVGFIGTELYFKPETEDGNV